MPYRRPNTSNWWITVGGVRQSAGTDNREDAAALEARLNHQLWLKKEMGVNPPRSWQEAVPKYLAERVHKASYSTMRQRLLWWHPHLGRIDDIAKISRDMIDAILQKHRPVTPQPSSANTTANKYALVVSAVLTAACREWGWIPSTPKFRRYPEPEHRRDFLTVEQWRTLEKELPTHLLLPATFALATGLRAEKVFKLEWSQIDMTNRVLRITGNALKRANTIPLNATAMRVVESINASPVRHITRVFTWRGEPLQDYGKAWYKARDRAGLPNFPWHGFRHTFASWLAQSGASEMVIDQLCGWAEKDTRGIYTHLDTAHLRPFSEMIDGILALEHGVKVFTMVRYNDKEGSDGQI